MTELGATLLKRALESVEALGVEKDPITAPNLLDNSD